MAKVIMYTKYGCPKCNMTKAVLDGEEIEYSMINVEDDEAAMTYVKDTLGLTEMPVIVAEGYETFTGFKPDLVKALK